MQSLNEQNLSREAIASGKPVVVLDAANDPRTDKLAVEYFEDKSLLIVPLSVGDRPFGTLYLNSVTDHHYYTEKDIQIALSISGEAASATMDNRGLAIRTSPPIRPTGGWVGSAARLAVAASSWARAAATAWAP